MAIVKKILFDCFTGRNNSTFDIGRILWAVSIIAYIILGLVNHYVFDPEKFAFGLASLLAAGGAALGFKKSTEPKL